MRALLRLADGLWAAERSGDLFEPELGGRVEPIAAEVA
jgi:hypothetical protein